MPVRPSFAIAAGAIISAAVAFAGGAANDGKFATELGGRAEAAIADTNGAPVTATFANSIGMPTRHPVLSGGEDLDETTRDRVAKAVANQPGIGGISWSDGSMVAESGIAVLSPLHCQEDVQALLEARTIRFEESSSGILGSSETLLDEVSAALSPCLGSTISITGHTDATGPEPENMALSLERAQAVRAALITRGIPLSAMRAEGVGSSEPIEGFEPQDAANRRIEFAVISTAKLQPSPIDTPGPR